VVLSPLLDDDLCFSQAIEDFTIKQFIAKLCCDIPASGQAVTADLSCAINTSIWRSSVIICSELNLLFGMTQATFRAIFSQRFVQKSRVRSHPPARCRKILAQWSRKLHDPVAASP
jgi:hypothetical protein